MICELNVTLFFVSIQLCDLEPWLSVRIQLVKWFNRFTSSCSTHILARVRKALGFEAEQVPFFETTKHFPSSTSQSPTSPAGKQERVAANAQLSSINISLFKEPLS